MKVNSCVRRQGRLGGEGGASPFCVGRGEPNTQRLPPSPAINQGQERERGVVRLVAVDRPPREPAIAKSAVGARNLLLPTTTLKVGSSQDLNSVLVLTFSALGMYSIPFLIPPRWPSSSLLLPSTSTPRVFSSYICCFFFDTFLCFASNAKPSVNGAPSDHPVFGWGGGGGRVYQKAYVEFFTSEALLDEVLEACASRPELNYYAVGCVLLLLLLFVDNLKYHGNYVNVQRLTCRNISLTCSFLLHRIVAVTSVFFFLYQYVLLFLFSFIVAASTRPNQKEIAAFGKGILARIIACSCFRTAMSLSVFFSTCREDETIRLFECSFSCLRKTL